MLKSPDMKQHLNFYIVGRIVLVFEIILCVVTTLSVLMVNGIESFSADHLSLLILIGITIATKLFINSANTRLNKAVFWMAVLPFMLISYELVSMFLPYHVHTA
jgi:hypothetical protein